MTLYRLADLHLVYKLQEIMQDNGFNSNQYRIIDGYPSDSDLLTSELWPTLTVETDLLYGRNIELGSGDWPAVQFSIDVFAKTDGQRDDISYWIWESLNENDYILYNFNEGFPSSIGDYSGISSLGSWSVSSLTITNFTAPEDTILEGEKHHCMLNGIIFLPNL